MIDAVERILNLALLFVHARGPVTVDRVRDEVAGYPHDQDEAAFLRMFERDKDELRAAGFEIVFDDEQQSYSLDTRGTFAGPLELTDEESATLRLVGSALLDDPSFPLREPLRLALAKLAAETAPGGPHAGAVLADEEPDAQGAAAATFTAAAENHKRVRFEYTNASGAHRPHEIEPFGVFLHDGRWYVVGRDIDIDQERTYAIARASHVVANASAPRTPDFERPEEFDLAAFVRLPFQYGPPDEEFEAVLRIDGSAAWRAGSLSAAHGSLTHTGDGIEWRVPARSTDQLVRFAIENGPGIGIVDPPHAVAALRTALRETEALHG